MTRRATALLCAVLVTVAAVSAVAAPVVADTHDGDDGLSVYPISDCPFGEYVTETVETPNTTLRVTVCSERRTYVHEPARHNGTAESTPLNGTVGFAPTVENVGNRTADTTLSLAVNDTERDTVRVVLAPGERVEGNPADRDDRYTLNETFSEAGERNATVAGVGATVDVRDPGVCAAAAPDGPDFWLTPPQDLNGDGRCEDYDGDGTVTFGDLIDFAFWPFDEIDYVPPFDCDGDGDVDFDDVIECAFRV